MWPRTRAGEQKHRKKKREREIGRAFGAILKCLEEKGVHKRPLKVLEFGSGNGFQIPYLKQFGQVVASDINRSEGILSLDQSFRFCQCDITRASFKDGQFDLVYSNHVLEHIDDLQTAFSELKRIGKAECLYVFSLPTNIWLVLTIPAQYRARIGLWLRNLLRPGRDGSQDGMEDAHREMQEDPLHLQDAIVPQGHGVFTGFIECYAAFKIRKWERLLESSGFKVLKVEPLLLYGPSEWPVLPTTSLLNKTGICSSVLFIVSKPNDLNKRAESCREEASAGHRLQGKSGRVIMVVPYVDEAGGMERQALQLAGYLAGERDLDVSILTTVYPRRFLKRWRQGKQDPARVRIYRLPVPGRYGMFLPFFGLLGTVALAFFRHRYDILHCHQLFSAGIVGAFARIMFGKPALVKAACGGVQGDVWVARQHLFADVLKGLLARMDLFVCLSAQIRDEIRSWVGCPDRKFVRLPNVVDVERFVPVRGDQRKTLRRRLSLGRGGQAIFIGRLDPIKGIDTLIDLWPDVVEACPEAHLAILGAGPAHDQLERVCQAPGLQHTVSFRGWVQNVSEYFQAADLLVLPSLSEGMPNVVLEAMACGLPVVATRIGGTRETVQDGVTGLLVEVGDRAALKDAIVRVLTKPEVRIRLGKAARERAEKIYSLQAVADQYIALYRQLLK